MYDLLKLNLQEQDGQTKKSCGIYSSSGWQIRNYLQESIVNIIKLFGTYLLKFYLIKKIKYCKICLDRILFNSLCTVMFF